MPSMGICLSIGSPNGWKFPSIQNSFRNVPLCSDVDEGDSTEENKTAAMPKFCAMGSHAVSECTGGDSHEAMPNPEEIDSSHFTLNDCHTIGVGGFGMVNLVLKLTPSDSGGLYAVKSISKRSVLARARPNVSPVASVFNELQCLQRLSGSNTFISGLVHAWQDRRHLFMCFEYCSGGDLRYNLKLQPGTKYPERVAKFFIAQALLAIRSCHHALILHRDLKPENLLVTNTGYLRLTDFGISKPFSSRSQMEGCRSTSGTHGYMAPEVYFKKHVHGRSADYFSIGVTLHELCTGQRPFSGSTIRSHCSDMEGGIQAQAQVGHTSGHTSAGPNSGPGSAFKTAPPSAYQRPSSYQRCGPPLDVLERTSTSTLSPECKDFISCLLDFDPYRRLGGQSGEVDIGPPGGGGGHLLGVGQAKAHPWFSKQSPMFDWEGLRDQTMESLVMPQAKHRKMRFEPQDFNRATLEENTLSMQHPPISREDDRMFQGFRYKTKL